MYEINNDKMRNILFDISNKIIIPKRYKLKEEEIKYKNHKDIVTSVDIEVENKLKKILLDLIPNSLFIGEESCFDNSYIIKSYQSNNYCWTVDPIDGTKNFVKGNEKFTIMVALSFKKKILQSWIYKPLSEEFCYAKYKKGAFINNKQIIINKNFNRKHLVGSISKKYWDNDYKSKIFALKKNFTNINSYGCISLEYIDIASQIRDFALLSKLSPWDHIPGILFLREAGGVDNHFDLSPYKFYDLSNNLIVSNSSNLNINILNKLEDIKL